MLNFYRLVSYIQKNEGLKLFGSNVRQTERETKIAIFDFVLKGG